MILTVKGGTARQQELVSSMAHFCAAKLMPRMYTLEVEITLKKLTGAYGYCLHVDDRYFEIEVSKDIRHRRLLETVAHEMVHVKQYARRELSENTYCKVANRYKWQGETLKKTPEYWDRPWEIEAHGREVGLFIRWAEENNLGNKKWTHDV